jgi:kynurenine 3-monooxygenase
MKKDQHIAIVGAGLVGSMLSLLLARKGFHVDLYEKRSDPRHGMDVRRKSINLALSYRGWKALSLIGADKEMHRYGLPMYGRMIHSIDQTLSYQQYDRNNQAIYSVSRKMLNELLLDMVNTSDNINLYFNHELSAIRDDLSGGTMKNTAINKEVDFAADFVIGADGVFSKVRDEIDKRTGDKSRLEYHTHAYKELNIPPGPGGSWGMNPTALHIWPRHTFMMIALPNPDKSFTCTLFMPLEGEVSFASLQTSTDLHNFFIQYFPDMIPLMPTLEQDFFERGSSGLNTVVSDHWHYNNKLMIVGDAAHGILPFYGQGMNAGFEDCAIIDEFLDTLPNWNQLPARFFAARKKDADAIGMLSQENFTEMREKAGASDFLLRKSIEHHLTSNYPRQWPSVYSMVSFSDKSYNNALEISEWQAQVMDEIMNIENIAQVWKEIDYIPLLDPKNIVQEI